MGQGVIVIALCGLLVLVIACIDRYEHTSSCRDIRTKEELNQVRDANGELFPVIRVVSEIGSLTIDDCGVPDDAQLGRDEYGYADVAGIVYHPFTGEEILVTNARRGIYEFRWPSGYEWK